jgi:hypothetical protein
MEDQEDAGVSYVETKERNPSHDAIWEQVFDPPAEDPAKNSDPRLLDETECERLRKRQLEKGDAPWAPFASHEEWELALWLMKRNISQQRIESFL